MPEYLEDPSVLTKDKLKSELLAHNVELPGGNPTKDVYVRLYLEKLTGKNHKLVPGALDAFSSDEELQLPPVVSSRSRSSGRKATRKTDRSPEEFDVSSLTDSGLKDELLKHGVDAGPIVASTRKLYEKKLQRFLDEGATKTIITEIQTNGNTETEIYSDKEDEVTPEPEPEPEPEPVPVVQRPLRSRGKTPVSSRTSSHTHTQTVEKIAASEPAPAPKDDQNDVLKELFPNDINSPTGISATCRRPIRGASRRPVKYDDFWNDENRVFSPKTSKTSSSFTSSSTSSSFSTVNRVSSLPPSSSSSSSSSRLLLSAPPPSSSSSSSSAAAAKTPYRRVSLWIKLLLLAVLAGFLFLVYQAMETNANSPFNAAEIDGKAA